METHCRRHSVRFRWLLVSCIIASAFCLQRSGLAQYVAQRLPSSAMLRSSSAFHARGAVRISPRFLGWNYARRAGAAYFRHFARPRYGLAIPVQNPSFRRSLMRMSGMATSASSLAPPPLPGFLFRPKLPAGFLPTSVATGDFNGDGRMDWVVANGGDNNLWLYLGNGDGTSQLPTIIPLAGRSPVAVAAADLRGNGILDLVVAEADSQTVGVLLGNGHGGFGTETEYALPAPPLCLLVRDFNGDDHPDILVGMAGTQQTGGLAFLPGNGDGTFGAPITSPGPANAANVTIQEMAAADLNGDKLPDVVANDTGSAPGIWVYLNQGKGKFGPPQPGPVQTARAALSRISLWATSTATAAPTLWFWIPGTWRTRFSATAMGPSRACRRIRLSALGRLATGSRSPT